MRVRATDAAATRARALLAEVRGQDLPEARVAAATVELAEALTALAEVEKTAADRTHARLLARLMSDPDGQAFTTFLTDRVHRSRAPDRVVDESRYLLRRLGVPAYLPAFARLQLQLLLRAGPFVPELAARAVLQRLREESRNVVISAEESALQAHLHKRRQEGVHVNINHLGEAVLGEREAKARIDDYLALLARPEVEAISVKLSSIASRIELLPWQETLDDLRPRLRGIYRAALAHRYARPDGSLVPKLVSVDMEAYRDLRLTAALFTSLLDEPELRELGPCIVLQAYLPDSFALQKELTTWAAERVRRGGVPVRLRIVKGANLAVERVESSQRGWPLPIYETKAEVDANYKRMVDHGCLPEHARAVHIGIASHNVFDLALGLVLRESRQVQAQVGFELLEGMADPLRRALQSVADDVLLYCPIVSESSMQTAIAYLTRRLDENTAEENFLRRSFAMQVGDASWQAEQARFKAAYASRDQIALEARRVQDRRQPPERRPVSAELLNEADTDFSLLQNRIWIGEALSLSRTRERFDVPMQIGGEALFREPCELGFDPSRPDVVPYRHALAADGDIERCLDTAARAAPRVAQASVAERSAWLVVIAHGLRCARAELIAAMVLDAGKRVDQADAEVSEAIDFAEYYRRSYAEHAALPQLRLAPKGVVLVTPPWNFPLAIPAGGVLAALMAGNAVILKPALETVLVAERFAEICWQAGIPKEALQLLFCADALGSRLIRDARVQSVVLTGATSTAHLFKQLRPGLDLLAETGGKNAIVVSAVADRDAAIKDALHSAFGHSGQKCSAASLLICEAEVYDDPAFLSVLQDAAASLPVGPAWDLRSVVTPLIHPPSGALGRALTTLEDGERWLLQPRVAADNPRLWSPGVKLGVAPGGFTHTTELFGPVLGVMRADDLDHAIKLANDTPYGLTAGLCSLDEREQVLYAARMDAGNLYINRGITGAIVRRQPFGGHKASSFGPGAKAGGPNYVLQLCRRHDGAAGEDLAAPTESATALLLPLKHHLPAKAHERLARAACTYAHALRSHFAQNHDPSSVLGEINVFRYRACSPMLVRAAADAELGDALLTCVAAVTASASITLSVDPALVESAPWLAEVPFSSFAAESPTAAAERLSQGIKRVRAVGTVEPAFLQAAEQSGVHVACEPVLSCGRIELLHYFLEQTISIAYHRYGNLQGRRLLSFV